MLKTQLFTLVGLLGAAAVFDTEKNTIAGFSLFGRGLDGNDAVLKCEGTDSSGEFVVFREVGDISAEWPAPVNPATRIDIGTVRVKREGDGLRVDYDIASSGLSIPSVNFSPQPEYPDRYTGSWLLSLLA